MDALVELIDQAISELENARKNSNKKQDAFANLQRALALVEKAAFHPDFYAAPVTLWQVK